MKQALLGVLTLLTTLSLPASPTLAVYTQPASTFSAGGGVSTSASYENLGVIGQPGIVGSSSSAGYTANHGFLSVLGDGFKILYPVIAVDKGSFSFILVSNSSASDTLAISNAGGSTLNWSIAKSPTATWLTTTPPSGSGAFTVNITADTAGLVVGSTHNETLTISGAGIEQTQQLLVSLSVTAPATYRLTVTIVSDHPTKGGGDINSGDGRIVCSNTGGDPATATGICQANLVAGSSITLMQTPHSDSTLATWSGGCSGNGDCGVTNIAANTAVTATFPYSFMAKVNSSGNGYESLGQAYSNAATTDTIKTRTVTFVEGTAGSVVTLNGGKTINILGGLDAYYLPTGGFTTIQNVLKVGGVGNRLNIRGGVKVHQ